MRDWNLRVMLHRIWRERDRGYRSWAIQRDPDVVDSELWDRREVDVLDALRRGDYVAGLNERLQALPAKLRCGHDASTGRQGPGSALQGSDALLGGGRGALLRPRSGAGDHRRQPAAHIG